MRCRCVFDPLRTREISVLRGLVGFEKYLRRPTGAVEAIRRSQGHWATCVRSMAQAATDAPRVLHHRAGRGVLLSTDTRFDSARGCRCRGGRARGALISREFDKRQVDALTDVLVQRLLGQAVPGRARDRDRERIRLGRSQVRKHDVFGAVRVPELLSGIGAEEDVPGTVGHLDGVVLVPVTGVVSIDDEPAMDEPGPVAGRFETVRTGERQSLCRGRCDARRGENERCCGHAGRLLHVHEQ